LEAWREARLIRMGSDYCRLVYAPPSTAGIVAQPAAKEEQTHFRFFEKLSFKKQDHAAAASILQGKQPVKRPGSVNVQDGSLALSRRCKTNGRINKIT
jgi:hypothetical protein